MAKQMELAKQQVVSELMAATARRRSRPWLRRLCPLPRRLRGPSPATLTAGVHAADTAAAATAGSVPTGLGALTNPAVLTSQVPRTHARAVAAKATLQQAAMGILGRSSPAGD